MGHKNFRDYLKLSTLSQTSQSFLVAADLREAAKQSSPIKDSLTISFY